MHFKRKMTKKSQVKKINLNVYLVVSLKVNDAISSDLLFDEKIIKNVDESEEMLTTRFNIDLYS